MERFKNKWVMAFGFMLAGAILELVTQSLIPGFHPSFVIGGFGLVFALYKAK